MSTAFNQLPLSPELLKCLETLKYSECTEIQGLAIPHALKRKDVIAQAKTGSGKTVAFGLPLLQQLNVKQYHVQSLILCPTRELADQVAKEIRTLARFIGNVKVLLLCGGMPMGPQLGSLEHGAHIIVGTPGRINAVLRKNRLDLTRLKTLVLDEADRMLDMGFQEDLETIVAATPNSRQTMLFSATFPDDIDALSRNILRDPISVEATESHQRSTIAHHFYPTTKQTRFEDLTTVFKNFQPDSCIVFCNTKQSCNEVVEQLQAEGVPALALHGDFEQKQRDQVLLRFGNKSCTVLVATDVAARGLHIDQLAMVVNFELSRSADTFTHRVGRTGRAGESGLAVSLISKNEAYKLEEVNILLNLSIEVEELTPPTIAEVDFRAPMVTLGIDGGKKDKVRPGDILGALTGSIGLKGSDIGKINIFPFESFVAVERSVANQAMNGLNKGKIKNRQFKVRRLRIS